MRSQRGQTLIEALAGITVFVVFVTALISGFYILWVKQRLSEMAYETLVCQETREEKFCDLKFRRDVRAQIPFGRVKIQDQRKSSRESTLVIRYEQKPISFSVTQNLKLPLR